MKSSLRNALFVTAVVVIVLAAFLAGSALLAAKAPAKSPKMPSGCCPVQGNTVKSGSPHGMMGGASAACPMNEGVGCVSLSGKVTAVGRDGSLTVRLKTPAGTSAAAKKSISRLKAGQNVSMVIVLNGSQRALAKPVHPTRVH